MLELFVNINVYYQKYLSNCLVVSEKSCNFALERMIQVRPSAAARKSLSKLNFHSPCAMVVA